MLLSEIDISEKKINQFNKKGISSVEELVHFYPIKYKDYRQYKDLNEYEDGDKCSIIITIKDIDKYQSKTTRVEVTGIERNSLKVVKVVWFNRPYIYHTLWQLRDMDVAICGTMTINNFGYQIVNPDLVESDFNKVFKIIPFYSNIQGMSADYLGKSIDNAIACKEWEDFVSEGFRKKFGVISEAEMLYKIHHPESERDILEAKKRIVFDQLYHLIVQMTKDEIEINRKSDFKASKLTKCNQVIDSLPYELTEDQKHVIAELVYDTKKGKRINALIQGDVGCGKTICAMLLMLAMSDNGYQSVLMAPTGVLAKQHYDEIQRYLKPFGLEAVYLSGDMKASEKKKVLKKIENGETDFVIGTHSVITDSVKFKNLALTIVDEEHKFGVIQKENLRKKAEKGVHSVTMSATPIPRSLAMTLYDDALDIYTITTMPNGRKPIKTAIINNTHAIYKFMQLEINKGHQCYIVCPKIEDKEDVEDDPDYKSVEAVYTEASDYFGRFHTEVAAITGKMKEQEKMEILERFQSGEIKVLIATTIIEVGVNVPNATVIAIMSSHRFGLSGLHQLRGRVGRNSLQSYCILQSSDTKNERLLAMCESTNGFYLAEKDLQMRGAGDFTGTKQSGSNETINLVIQYPKLYRDMKKAIRNGET